MMISGYISLGVQFSTGIVDIWGLTLPLSPEDYIFKELLAIELMVQTIEFCFYIWLVLNLHKENITIYRYYDWFLTTPSMLITLCAFLAPEKNLSQFLKKNANSLSMILLFNALMLLCGWKAEMQPLQTKYWVSWGFLFYVLTFSYLFIAFFPQSKHPIFVYFLFFWSIYGIAAILPYKTKNNIYNILDLFSKNAFGIYLTWVIYQKSKIYQNKKKVSVS